MFGFEIRAVIFVFLKPVSEAWKKNACKVCFNVRIRCNTRERIICLCWQSGRGLCLSGAWLRSSKSKACKNCSNVRTRCYTREVTVFGSAIQVVSSVFLKLGSEVKNKKLVKFGSMCESEAI